MTKSQSLTTDEKLRNIIRRWRPEIEPCISAITPLTPDASLRRYFRIAFSSTPCDLSKKSIVAMVFDSVAGAEVAKGGSKRNINSDQAYVELTNFFLRFQVPVPGLFYDARDDAVLLVEDVGETQLIETIIGDKQPSFGEEVVDEFCRQAVDEIVRIMSIPAQPGFFAFERSFTRELYQSEMGEFREFVLAPLHLHDRERQTYDMVFQTLADELETFPQVLVHRDFHSWNLLLDEKKKIRIVDFQDALLGTRTYDLVSLLNDRDTDTALGKRRYEMLLNYFFDRLGCPNDFFREYYRVLLQRDLKVAGRFAKLSKLRGLSVYERWIPGTLNRIGKTLAMLSAEEPRSVYALLSRFTDLCQQKENRE